MHRKIKRVTILTIGIIFVFFGILGLALPFLQGFLFLAIGLILLSVYSPAAHERIEKITKRYPKFHAIMEKIETWVARTIGQP